MTELKVIAFFIFITLFIFFLAASLVMFLCEDKYKRISFITFLLSAPYSLIISYISTKILGNF